MTDDSVSPVHVWIARLGVLGIAVIAFLFVYDAGVSFASAVGYRPGLTRLWPWLIEGFLALVVYSGGIIRRRGGSIRYTVTLFLTLLGVSGYMNVRVHTHHGSSPLALSPLEAGAASALPVLILAASIHLLLSTFERPRVTPEAPVQAPPVMPDALTVGKIQEAWAAEPEPAPIDVVHQAETEPDPTDFSLAELNNLPEQPTRPQLRGQAGTFLRLAEQAQSAKAKAFWAGKAEAFGPAQPSLF